MSGIPIDLDKYETYEDYLDDHITETDQFYLEDIELARQLIELGYNGDREIVPREDFDLRKAETEKARNLDSQKKPNRLASAGLLLTLSGRRGREPPRPQPPSGAAEDEEEGDDAIEKQYPMLIQLAKREESIRSGRLSTIIFIRTQNAAGQEVSGYIDYGERLVESSTSMEAVFARRKALIPRPNDLSYYNWETQTCTSNPTSNFEVIAENGTGLLFRNNRDRKIINVDPKSSPGDNSTRTEIATSECFQCVLYDHINRRRA